MGLQSTEADAFDGLQTVTVNGVSLAYRERGSGTSVVFVHGSASDLRTWDKQLPVFGERYRAIAYSRRYARPNKDIGDGVDDPMLLHVEDLVVFLRSLEIETAHLIGHSWGGFIALLAAIRYPEAVRSLVLLEPPVVSLFASTPPRPFEILRLLLRRPGTAFAIIKFGATAFAPARKAYLRGDDEAAMRAFGHGVLGKASYEQLPDARKQQVRDNQKADRAQLLGHGLPPLTDQEVRGMHSPCLLLVGERCPGLLRRLSDRLRELLPAPEFVEIASASHLMQEDNAAMVNETIMDFLSRQSSP